MPTLNNPQYREGQRWLADNEPSLGLGTLIEVEFRQLTLIFPATGETRIYASENPPLTRIAFSTGDRIKSDDQWEMVIERIDNDEGYLTYHGLSDDGSPVQLEEIDLDNRLRFNTPRDRLFAGQLDSHKWFRLRTEVFKQRLLQQRSIIRGLSGARVAVIPHQIYIATEVGSRLRPRVLLADEVGLGKTIEAGLILQKQLTQGLISRVIIAVPEALLHQWLVEMLRKFNLHFHIMDEDRFDAQRESEPGENPFLSEQLVLCNLSMLTQRADICEAASGADWDCLVVDEAHHLKWSEDEPSDSYVAIEKIAADTGSVLLLTATPEQLGRNSHFARLKLLDPKRFSSLEEFEKEEKSFSRTAQLANRLLGAEELDEQDLDLLEAAVGEKFDTTTRDMLIKEETRQLSQEPGRLVSQLIDRHGTGRVLFRNSRRTISGFPGRSLHTYSLNPDASDDNHNRSMHVEALWLQEFLQQIKPERSLVVCSKRETVEAIQERLRELGIQCAVFHEGMSIVERDRSAAWFSDSEDGCRLLVCSEIGSEGRNFQFLHHMVLLEIPDNPDLLEQRIGRLDRIGQTYNVEIHVPTLPGSKDELLTRWYHDGLNAFEQSCRVGSSVRKAVEGTLNQLLTTAEQSSLDSENAEQQKLIDELLNESKELSTRLQEELEQGRDRLLELNSNRQELIEEHLDLLRREEQNWNLRDFMASMFNCFGVDYEEQSNGSWIAKPSDNMHIDSFPHLSADGLTLCFDRELALEREEITFLSWDHPMITDVMDLVLDESLGQTNVLAIRSPRFPRGIALVEAIYTHECVAPESLGVSRYLNSDLQHFLLGSNRKDYTASIDELDTENERQRVDLRKLRGILAEQHDIIKFLLDHSEKLANATVSDVVEQAKEMAATESDAEIKRLSELQKINPSVRQDEIDALVQHREDCQTALNNTEARLVSVRVLFNV